MGTFDLLSLGAKIIDKIIPDPAQKAQAQLALFQAQQNGTFKEMDDQLQRDIAQIQVNLADANSKNWFQAGWRPFIGWICGFALAYEFLFRVIFGYLAKSLWQWDAMPPLNMGDLMTVLGGILGLGALRTVEKKAGVE
jgi:hypothetical protein